MNDTELKALEWGYEHPAVTGTLAGYSMASVGYFGPDSYAYFMHGAPMPFVGDLIMTGLFALYGMFAGKVCRRHADEKYENKIKMGD